MRIQLLALSLYHQTAKANHSPLKFKIMKNAIFTFAPTNTNYKIYNTTEGFFHCVAINKKGEMCSPNAKTLKTISEIDFNFGVKTSGIVIF